MRTCDSVGLRRARHGALCSDVRRGELWKRGDVGRGCVLREVGGAVGRGELWEGESCGSGWELWEGGRAVEAAVEAHRADRTEKRPKRLEPGAVRRSWPPASSSAGWSSSARRGGRSVTTLACMRALGTARVLSAAGRWRCGSEGSCGPGWKGGVQSRAIEGRRLQSRAMEGTRRPSIAI